MAQTVNSSGSNRLKGCLYTKFVAEVLDLVVETRRTLIDPGQAGF